MMGVLVGLTSRVKIGTSVLVVPYRNPVVTAKMLATLDVMSGGRMILGAGVGWMKEEFETLQAPPFTERGKVTDEYLRLMRDMWTKEPVEFMGAHYRLPSVSAMPKPRQKGGIPIWIGRPHRRRAAPHRRARGCLASHRHAPARDAPARRVRGEGEGRSTAGRARPGAIPRPSPSRCGCRSSWRPGAARRR